MGWGHDKVNIYQDIVLVVYQGGKMNCTLHSTEAMAAPPAQNFVLMRNWETNQVVGWWVSDDEAQTFAQAVLEIHMSYVIIHTYR